MVLQRRAGATPAPVLLDDFTRRMFGVQATAYSIKESLVRGFNRISLRTLGMVNDPRTVIYPPSVVGNFSVNQRCKRLDNR